MVLSSSGIAELVNDVKHHIRQTGITEEQLFKEFKADSENPLNGFKDFADYLKFHRTAFKSDGMMLGIAFAINLLGQRIEEIRQETKSKK